MEPRTQIAGVTAIVDASDFGFKHFRKLSLQDLKYAAMFTQVCYSFLDFLKYCQVVLFTAEMLNNSLLQKESVQVRATIF